MKDTEDEWMPTLDVCFRYRVGSDLLKTWRRWKTFPEDAVIAQGRTLLWNVPALDAWLRERPLSRVGRPPRWTEVVNHPEARNV